MAPKENGSDVRRPTDSTEAAHGVSGEEDGAKRAAEGEPDLTDEELPDAVAGEPTATTDLPTSE